MAIISIIGNAPSSGSTFFADLLDSSVSSACGLEMNLFSNRKTYDLSKYKKNIFCSSRSSSVYRFRNKLNLNAINSYGFNKARFSEMVNDSMDLNAFVEDFASEYLAFRNKDSNGIWFEKTPENINCIGEFLRTFKNAYFIHIVRNPLYVYLSLLNRGFPKYVALTTWLVDVAKYFKYRNDKRVILIKYEELVEQPFKIVGDIIKLITNKDVLEEEIKYGYESNRYRMEHLIKLESWKVKEYGVIKNANNVIPGTGDLIAFSKILSMKINPEYAEIFDLGEISFIESIKEFGYYDQIVETLSSVKFGSEIPTKTIADYKQLLIKWFRDYMQNDSKWSYLKYYLNPIQKV